MKPQRVAVHGEPAPQGRSRKFVVGAGSCALSLHRRRGAGAAGARPPRSRQPPPARTARADAAHSGEPCASEGPPSTARISSSPSAAVREIRGHVHHQQQVDHQHQRSASRTECPGIRHARRQMRSAQHDRDKDRQQHRRTRPAGRRSRSAPSGQTPANAIAVPPAMT